MKNIVIIDVDTTRDKVMMLKKPSDISLPQNPEEAKKMVLEDVSCVFEAFCMLLDIIDKNSYGKKNEMLETAIKHLNSLVSVKETEK